MPILRRRRSFGANFAAYLGYIEPLYRAISTASGGRRVVDSSKVLSQFGALAALADVDLSLVHLVRDSRGVAHSWTRRILRPEITSDRQYMATFNPTWMALQWDLTNVAFDVAQIALYRDRPSVMLRYEAFAADPVQSSKTALAFVSGTQSDKGISSSPPSAEVRVGVQHTVAGNPTRFSGPVVTINPDVRWRAEMPGRSRALVTAVTWPVLIRYAVSPSIGQRFSRSRSSPVP